MSVTCGVAYLNRARKRITAGQRHVTVSETQGLPMGHDIAFAALTERVTFEAEWLDGASRPRAGGAVPRSCAAERSGPGVLDDVHGAGRRPGA